MQPSSRCKRDATKIADVANLEMQANKVAAKDYIAHKLVDWRWISFFGRNGVTTLPAKVIPNVWHVDPRSALNDCEEKQEKEPLFRNLKSCESRVESGLASRNGVGGYSISEKILYWSSWGTQSYRGAEDCDVKASELTEIHGMVQYKYCWERCPDNYLAALKWPVGRVRERKLNRIEDERKTQREPKESEETQGSAETSPELGEGRARI
ncbi:hypothetical protein R3P38DRAFT_2791277 [Favolaschia claudopus]|uniref:Uncharacterized protein n=1 Tax=Favolaschia claudopus TaxID=2862362 RepID=A0AAW0AH65_9AGAR